MASDVVHSLPEEDRDWEGRSIAIVKLFLGIPRKAHAVRVRLEALDAMLQSNKLPGWVTPKEADGSIRVAEPVWIAAASEPLMLGKYQARFDEERFVDRVLELADSEGSA